MTFVFCLEVKLSLAVYSKLIEIYGHVEFRFLRPLAMPLPDRHPSTLNPASLNTQSQEAISIFPLRFLNPDSAGHVVEIYVLCVKFDFLCQLNDVIENKDSSTRSNSQVLSLIRSAIVMRESRILLFAK